MAENRIPRVTIEDARIIFRNFEGRGDQYNREGDRNFGCVIPENMVEPMQRDGWNVKFLRPRDEDDTPTAYVPVKVSYNPNARPPEIILIKSNGRVQLQEELVSSLDFMDIKSLDIILHPYAYEVNGKSGIKAYLHKMYVTVNEDELDRKYSDVPDVVPVKNSAPRFEDEPAY